MSGQGGAAPTNLRPGPVSGNVPLPPLSAAAPIQPGTGVYGMQLPTQGRLPNAGNLYAAPPGFNYSQGKGGWIDYYGQAQAAARNNGWNSSFDLTPSSINTAPGMGVGGYGNAQAYSAGGGFPVIVNRGNGWEDTGSTMQHTVPVGGYGNMQQISGGAGFPTMVKTPNGWITTDPQPIQNPLGGYGNAQQISLGAGFPTMVKTPNGWITVSSPTSSS